MDKTIRFEVSRDETIDEYQVFDVQVIVANNLVQTLHLTADEARGLVTELQKVLSPN